MSILTPFVLAAALVAAVAPPRIGQQAPDFTLRDQTGKRVSLSDARGQKTVLVFYRGYWWPYCVRQVAGLRDLARAYRDVHIYAVSPDSPEQSRSLAAKIAEDGRGPLGFSLLFDAGSVVIGRYGLRDPEYAGQKLDGVPHPSVFVLDPQGRVRWLKIENDYRVRPSNEEVAAALDSFD